MLTTTTTTTGVNAFMHSYRVGEQRVQFEGTLAFASLFDSIPRGEEVPFVVSASLRLSQTEGQKRPVLLCTVQDTSGSMGAHPTKRLERCVTALDVLLEHDTGRLSELMGGGEVTPEVARLFPVLRDPEDAIAVVGFAHAAEVVVPCTRMGDSAVGRARSAILEMEPGGSTNIRDGLEKGLSIVERHGAAEGRFSILLVLTDGEDNMGFEKMLESERGGLACVRRLTSLRQTLFVSACISGAADCRLMDSLCERAQGMQIFVDERKDEEGIANIAAGVGGFILGCVREDVELRLYRVTKTLVEDGEEEADDDGSRCKRRRLGEEGRTLIESKKVLAREGEEASIFFAVPRSALATTEKEAAAEPAELLMEVCINGEVVAWERKVLRAAAEGAAEPAVNVACIAPTCKAVLAKTMREFAVALELRSREEKTAKAAAALLCGRRELEKLQSMCLPSSSSSKEEADFVMMSKDGEEEEEDRSLKAAAEALAAALKDISSAEASLASAVEAKHGGGESFQLLRGNAYRVGSDNARCDTMDANSRESSRTLSSVVAGISRARIESDASLV